MRIPLSDIPKHLLTPRVSVARAYDPHPPGMNKTEKRYEDHLTSLLQAGVIRWFRFEAVVLSVNHFDRMVTYKPDFLVQNSKAELEIHETKGTKSTQSGRILVWKEDARPKFRACADQFPIFRFIAQGWVPATRTTPGRWMSEFYGPRDLEVTDGKTTDLRTA